MSTYKSKSSIFVKIVTTGTLLLAAMISMILIKKEQNYGLLGGIVLSMLIIGAVIYFYANSINKIIIEKESIVLKKNIGEIKICKSDILEVSRLAYSNLTMTYGSKGVFGFIGNTMDDSTSFVKDRRNMLKITTKTNKYILSSDHCDQLLSEIKAL